MSKPNARYLIHSMTYVKLHPSDETPRTMGEQATRARPAAIEIHADVAPSRSWLPLNRAAQEALAALGVQAEIVPDPSPRPERREASTMLEASQARSKLAHEMYGPRLSDTDPVTGEARKPEAPRLASDKRE